jgi:predicted ATP-binding protein involved in virulence
VTDGLHQSLSELEAIVYDYYRQITSKQSDLNTQFKNDFLLKSFDFLGDGTMQIRLDIAEDELAKKREATLEALDTLGLGERESNVNEFFEKYTAVLKRSSERSKKKKEADYESIQVLFSNYFQLIRIDELIRLSKKYQDELKPIFEPLKVFEETVNLYLKEGKKKLYVTNRGMVRISTDDGTNLSVLDLSSGEKQIIAMIGNLVFFQEKYKSAGAIYIIDEPEISLHLAWQEIFIQTITTASPGSQFLIATHAPSILGDYGELHCRDLSAKLVN